jgi:rhodanese-related sulfurtransferase
MPENVDRSAVQRLVEGGAQLVDVLPAREYGEQHLPGAISIPLRKIEAEAPDKLDRTRPVVVYCWDGA